VHRAVKKEGPTRNNRGNLGVVTPGRQQCPLRAYDFLFTFDRNCVPSLVQFSRYSELFVESGKFFLLHVYLAPPLGVTPFEFHQDFWHLKTRVSCTSVRRSLRDPKFRHFDRTPASDEQTDRRNERRS